MTNLAVVHVSPAATVPAAIILMVATGWYWVRLARADVPESRRRIRRASLMLMMLLIITLLAGMSFVDPLTDPRRYAQVWTAAILLVAAIVISAVFDLINNIRIQAELQEREAAAGAAELIDALKKRKADAQERERGGGNEP